MSEACDSNRICDNGGGQFVVKYNYLNSFSVDTNVDLKKVKNLLKKIKFLKNLKFNMSLLSVGVIGYGVVGKRRIQYILQSKLKLKYISDVKFRKNYSKDKINYFRDYLDLYKQ